MSDKSNYDYGSESEEDIDEFVNDIKEDEDSETINQNDLYQLYLENEQKMFPVKLLWKKSRIAVTDIIGGEKEFMKLSPQHRKKLILDYMFRCEHIRNHILFKYNEIKAHLDKDKNKWVESLKRLIEDGGKAIIVGRVSRKYDQEDIVKLVDGVRTQLDKRELSEIANHLSDRFVIIKDDKGNPSSVKIVDPKKENESLSDLLNNMNISDETSIDNLIGKLKGMDLKSEKTKLSKNQIKGLINLLSDKSEFNDKYKTLKQLNELKKPQKVKVGVDSKGESIYATPLGSFDKNFNEKLYGTYVEFWNPYLTPQTKKPRFERTQEILRITRTGEKIYLLPQKIVIKGKSYVYVRRFFDFEDFLKQYQLQFVKKIEKGNFTTLDLNKIILIKNYFTTIKERTKKIKMYTDDDRVKKLIEKYKTK